MVQSSGSRLAACLGSSLDKGRDFAARFGVERVHGDLEALMHDPGVDAVYIALPNALHYAAVLAAARGKKHVLCEKPFAMSVAHAREMVAACRDAGVILRIAHPLRLDAAVGVGVHLLDLAQWVSGQRFVEVSAFTHPDRRRHEPDDTITVLGRLDNDCHAVVRATREVASAENNLIVEGAEATLITSALRFATEHVVQVRDQAGTTAERFPASPAYELEIVAFEGELHGTRSVLPDGEDSIQTVAVTQAVLQAIAERRSVDVPAVEQVAAGSG
jgi:predicted dehydrogenase